MRLNFQKTVIKVMLVFFMFSSLTYFIDYFANEEIKIHKEIIYKEALGNDFVNCTKSLYENKSVKNSKEILESPKLQKEQMKINLINIGSIIIIFGLFYLFSCWVVRFVTKEALSE